MAVKPIPDGYHTITPYLIVPDVKGLLDFLVRAFGAKQTHPPATGPDGKIMHAEAQIGDSRVMMGQSSPQHPAMPAMLYLYVDDVDAWYRRALEAGATSIREPEDQFYGDRSGGVKDRFDNQWWFGTHKEDVSPEELSRRMAKAKRQN